MIAEKLNDYNHNYCYVCKRPFSEGEVVSMIQTTNGTTHLIHKECLDDLGCEIRSASNIEKNEIEESSKLWRYMDLAKFVEMLKSSSIHFSSPDCFEDIFEGAHGVETNKTIWDDYYKSFFSASIITAPDNTWHRKDADALKENIEILLRQISEKHEKGVFISCWHNNEFESEAMWKMYAVNTKNAVAIQTTYGQLKDQLGERTEIRKIKYIDYDNRFVGINDEFWYKRKSFEHEREVRALLRDFDKIGQRGINVNVDLNKLIDNVYVSPYSPTWFKEIVEDIILKYGFTFHVKDSNMNAKPF